MSRLRSRVELALDALVAALGSWALYAQVLVLARASFTTIRCFAFVPLLAASLLLWHLRRSSLPTPARPEPEPDASPSPSARVGIVLPALAVAAAAGYALTRSDWIFWCFAAAVAFLAPRAARDGRGAASPERSAPRRLEAPVLLALCALAALLTAGAHRPDPDDAYYLSVPRSAIDRPELAPQTYDAIHDDGLPPLEQTLHLPQVGELLVALLSWLSGAPIQALFYVILPPLWAVVGTLAHWLLLRRFLPRREALLATALFVLLGVVWGDGHRTFGNFLFVRLFQGKSLFVTALLPLVVRAALLYGERPGIASWLRLSLAQSAAAGASVSGVPMAPLAAALALIPAFRRGAGATILAGLAASAPVALVALAAVPRFAPFRSLVGIDRSLPADSTTLGDVRAPLSCAALALLPWLCSRGVLGRARWMAIYSGVVLVVLFLPAVTSAAATVLGGVFSWRVKWAAPIPFLICLAWGAAARLAARPGRARWPAAGGLAAWTVAFVFAGPPSIERGTWTPLRPGRYKVEEGAFAAAVRTVELAPPGRPVLAAEPVAVHLPGLRGVPPRVAVRRLHLRKLLGFVPEADRVDRLALLIWATNAPRAFPLERALRSIEARGVGAVVVPRRHRDAAPLAEALRARGFAIEFESDYQIAARRPG